MKTINLIQLIIFAVLGVVLSSCVPKATEKKAACGVGQAFSTITRSCVNAVEARTKPVGTLSSGSLSQETAKTFTLTYTDANKNTALSCRVFSPSSNIVLISPSLLNGAVFGKADDLFNTTMDLYNAIPLGPEKTAAGTHTTPLSDALQAARSSFSYTNAQTQLGLLKAEAQAIISDASPLRASVSAVDYYSGLAITRITDLDNISVNLTNNCECSGGVCTTTVATKMRQSGAAGFSYTITDQDGEGDPKNVSLTISANSTSAGYLKPAVSSSYISTFNESATSTASTYAFSLPPARDYFGTASFSYTFSGVKNGSNYGLTTNGKVYGCMDLFGSSGLTDTSCTYVPNSGDSNYPVASPVATTATATVQGLLFSAVAKGTFGNNYTVQLIDATSTTQLIQAENFGLASSVYTDSFVRVVDNAIQIYYSPNTTPADIVSLINNDSKAKTLVLASDVGATTFTTMSSATSLSGGTDTFDKVSFTVNNGYASSTNSASVGFTLNPTDDPPYMNFAVSTPANTGLEDGGAIAVDLSATYADVDSTITACDVHTVGVDPNVDALVEASFLTNFTVNSCTCVAGSCTASVTPNANVSSTTAYNFYYRVTSLGLNSDYRMGSVNVTPVNDVPTLVAAAASAINENSSASPSFGFNTATVGPGGGGFETTQTLSLALSAATVPSAIIPNVACSNYTPGAGTPIGSKTPTAVGQYYFDTTNYACYVSTGTTISSWALYPSLTAFPICSFTSSGPGAPTGTPSSTGLIYLDTTNNRCYKSTTSWALDATVTTYKMAYVPNLNQSGATTITMTLTDSAGGVTTSSFPLTINSVDDPPYFISTITKVDTNEGGQVVAGPFTVDEDQGSSPDEDTQGLSITAISSDNTSVLPNTAITAFYDINDNGVEDTGESRALAATLEGPNVGDELSDSKLHSFYLKLSPVAGVSGNANVTVTVSDGTNTTNKTFALVVHSIAALHGGWANITATGIKSDKSGAPAAAADVQCNYNKGGATDFKACNGNQSCTGTDSPASLVTPDEVNVIYWDSANKRCYRSTGTSVFSWLEVRTSCPISRISPIALSTAITATSTSMTVSSTTGYPTSGILKIGTEQIFYTGKTSTTFKGLARGVNSTTAAAHIVGDVIRYNNSWENAIYDSSNAPTTPTPEYADQYYFDADLKSCHKSTFTNLSAAINTVVTTLTVSSTTDFPTSGSLMVGTEVMTYTGKTATTFTGVTRGTVPVAHIIGEAVWGWSSSSYTPSKVTLAWNSFTISGSGADATVTIAGWNVYRREKGFDYDFVNGFLKINSTDTMTISSATTKTFTDTTAVAGKVYYYLVRPVDSSTRHLTISTPEVYSEVRILAPTDNYSFVHRWMVNQEVCNSMHMTTSTTNKVDPTHNYRCPYKGPGESTVSPGYYDIEKDMLVDISESGCPYTAAPSCSATTGCVGIGDPNSGSVPGILNEVYYDRDAGMCYTHDGTSWVDYNSAVLTPTNVAKTNSALNAPLTNISMAKATAICQARSTATPLANLGVAKGATTNPVSAPILPTKKEYIAYSAAPYGMSDALVTDLEQGFSLNVQSRCNSSNANGIDSAFSDSSIPSTSYIFSLPGTASSTIRSIYTGSVPFGVDASTESCSSRYGVQDVYGNVAEWVKDSMTCASATTTTLTGAHTAVDAVINVADTSNFAATGTVMIGSEQITYSSKTATTFVVASRGANSTTAAAHSNADIVSNASDYYVCSTNTGTDLAQYDFLSGAYAVSPLIPTYRYKFDLITGPYNDINTSITGADGADGFLTNWDFRDELYSAGKFSFPMGMPINVDIGGTSSPLVSSPALNYLLDIGPTSGLTSSQLHEDGIIVNGADINNLTTNPTQTGSFAQGGSYLSGNRSGRYSSELVPDADLRSDVGFRCYIPVIKTDYPADAGRHTYSY
jgi:hypothetical protein